MSQPGVRLDRLIILSWAPPGSKPPQIPGYRVEYDWFIRPRPGKPETYSRARSLRSEKSNARIAWQYARRHGWLRPWRITMTGDDETGIRPADVAAVLEKCLYYRFVLVELAIDFEFGSKVNRKFVKQHGVFGKSRRRTDRGGKGQLRHGARKSGKLVRCYRKKEVQALRVEVELHSQLLKKHHIQELYDLDGVAFVVHPKHFRFVAIRWKALGRYLQARDTGDADTIIREAHERAEVSLNRALKYLRRNGVLNTHRFLRPMQINDSIQKALTKWAIDFHGGLNV